MASRRIEVVLTGDSKSLERALGRGEKASGKFGKVLGGAALGAGAALAGLGVAAKLGFDEFIEAEKVTAQTNAVLKSTGGIANVTAKEIQGLSERLMRKSGVDDEAIASGQNMLLTFTKVRNETGAGNKVFDEATKATLNLSVAMGKDMQSSAVLVGKALNDPVKGIGALSRVGVQLDADQKKLIKTMDASGNTMGAQKVILKELETQFGGSAEAAGKTFGGQLNIAKQSLSNMAGEIVGKMLPHLTSFVTTIQTQVIPWIQGFIDKLRGGGDGGLSGAFGAVKSFIVDVWWPAVKATFGVLREAFNAVVATFRAKEPELREIMAGVTKAISGIAVVFREVILPILRVVFTEVLPRVIGVAIEAIAGITKAISGIAGFISGIREKFVVFWEWLKTQALVAAGNVVEPFSHLPGKMGGWARDAKDEINAQLAKIETQKEIRISAKIFASLSQGAQNAPDNRSGDPRNPNQLAASANSLIDKYIAGNTGALVRALPSSSMALVAGLGSGIGVGSLMGAGPELGPFASSAARFGLRVTSGYREGAITANGTPSDHGRRKALDVSNGYNTPQMAAFFMSLVGNTGVKQAFYDPLGSIFGGRLSGYREGGHTDHVHVATYDKGGWLMPGLTLAQNNTGRPERIVGPGDAGGDLHATFVIEMDGETLWQSQKKFALRDQMRNGSTGIR